MSKEEEKKEYIAMLQSILKEHEQEAMNALTYKILFADYDEEARFSRLVEQEMERRWNSRLGTE